MDIGMAIRGILFDKDGTLLDFEASWNRVYRDLALELASGDAERADAMMVIGGLDPVTGRIKAGEVLSVGNTIDIARAWFPERQGAELDGLVAYMDTVFHRNGISSSVPVDGLADTLATLAGMEINVHASLRRRMR